MCTILLEHVPSQPFPHFQIAGKHSSRLFGSMPPIDVVRTSRPCNVRNRESRVQACTDPYITQAPSSTFLGLPCVVGCWSPADRLLVVHTAFRHTAAENVETQHLAQILH